MKTHPKRRSFGASRFLFAPLLATCLGLLVACEAVIDDALGLDDEPFEFDLRFVREAVDVVDGTFVVTEQTFQMFSKKWVNFSTTVNGQPFGEARTITSSNVDRLMFNFEFPENQTNEVVFTGTLGEQSRTEGLRFVVLNVEGGELYIELDPGGVVASEGSVAMTTNAHLNVWCNANADVGLRARFLLQVVREGVLVPWEATSHSMRPTQKRQLVRGDALGLRPGGASGRTYRVRVWAVVGWDEENATNRSIEASITFAYREPEVVVPVFVSSEAEPFVFVAFDQGANTNLSPFIEGLSSSEGLLRATNTVSPTMTYALDSTTGLHTNFSLAAPDAPDQPATLTRSRNLNAAANNEVVLRATAAYTDPNNAQQQGNVEVTVRLMVAPETIAKRLSSLFSSFAAHADLPGVTVGTLASRTPFLVSGERYVLPQGAELAVDASGNVVRMSPVADLTLAVAGQGNSNNVVFAAGEEIHFLADGRVSQGVLSGSQALRVGPRSYDVVSNVHFDDGLLYRGNLDSTRPRNLAWLNGVPLKEGFFGSSGLERALLADDAPAFEIDGLSLRYSTFYLDAEERVTRAIVAGGQSPIEVDGYTVDFSELFFDAGGELTRGKVDPSQEALLVDGYSVAFTELVVDEEGDVVRGVVAATQSNVELDGNSVGLLELLFTKGDRLRRAVLKPNQLVALGGVEFAFSQVAVVGGDLVRGQLAAAVSFGSPSTTYSVGEWMHFNDSGEFLFSAVGEVEAWFSDDEPVFFSHDAGSNTNLAPQPDQLNLADLGLLLATDAADSLFAYSLESSVPAGLLSSFSLSQSSPTSQAVVLTRTGDLDASQHAEVTLRVAAAYTDLDGAEQSISVDVGVFLFVSPAELVARSSLFTSTAPHADLPGVTVGALAADTPVLVGDRVYLAASNRGLDVDGVGRVRRLFLTEDETLAVGGASLSNDLEFAGGEALHFSEDGDLTQGTLAQSQSIETTAGDFDVVGAVEFKSGSLKKGRLDPGLPFLRGGIPLHQMSSVFFGDQGIERALVPSGHDPLSIDGYEVACESVFFAASGHVERVTVKPSQSVVAVDGHSVEFESLFFSDGELAEAVPKPNQTFSMAGEPFTFNRIRVDADGEIASGRLAEAKTIGLPPTNFAVDEWVFFDADGQVSLPPEEEEPN